jgi:UDP-glucose 4-epimerase
MPTSEGPSGRPRALVTGGAGFLGRHLCHRLVADGFTDVVALDHHRGDGTAAPIRHVAGDVRDADLVARCAEHADVVFHLAGIADPRACERDPDTAHAVNVDGTASVVRAAAGRRVVLLSSAVAYLPIGAAPIGEDAPVGGASAYATTKLAAERLCLDAAAAAAIETVIVRNFNTYGPGQAASFLVPQLVHRGLTDGVVQVASCRPVRDFTYVDDAVAALSALGRAPAVGGIFNLGSGRATEVGEVALLVARLLGVPVACGHEAVTGSAYLVADAGKLRATIGWTPQVALEEGVRRTIASVRD